ncbi:MAG: T9SS type A sorting domain-containing protein [Bacteroidia bacterium]|nr:T9SS type A sorting domain-containing protein [Bacteroidia bacterium]
MLKNLRLHFIFIFSSGLLQINYSIATIWLVGPSRTYTMPSQVSTLVLNGDTIDIDAGIYNSNVARWQANNLLLRGVGGFVHLKSYGLSYGDKAIWVIAGNNTRVEWIEFSECTSTSHNGAGIRQEGLNLTVGHCYFHNNENGILAGTLNPSKIVIEYTQFAYNGYGDGLSHNLYINNIDTLIFRYNYSHHAHVGHELKSRARVNIILYNRISNEATGDASREIDLPNGGLAFILGNEIEQGPNSQNSNIIGFGLEGLSNPAPHQLYAVNNTIVNDRSMGSFLSLQSGTSLLKAYNNIFAGPGTIINGSATILDTANNYYSTVLNAGFVNAAAYDYHMLSSSGAVNGGTNPGFVNSFSLSPVYEYVHTANMSLRITSAQLDIGAHEYGTATGINFTDPKNSELNIYPNPSPDGTFEIASNEKFIGITITDVLGKIVFERNKIEAFILPLKINGITGGIYFVIARGEGNTVLRRKIIILK